MPSQKTASSGPTNPGALDRTPDPCPQSGLVVALAPGPRTRGHRHDGPVGEPYGRVAVALTLQPASSSMFNALLIAVVYAGAVLIVVTLVVNALPK